MVKPESDKVSQHIEGTSGTQGHPAMMPLWGTVSTSILEQATQLVLGDARDTMEVAKGAHSRDYIFVLSVQNTKAQA